MATRINNTGNIKLGRVLTSCQECKMANDMTWETDTSTLDGWGQEATKKRSVACQCGECVDRTGNMDPIDSTVLWTEMRVVDSCRDNSCGDMLSARSVGQRLGPRWRRAAWNRANRNEDTRDKLDRVRSDADWQRGQLPQEQQTTDSGIAPLSYACVPNVSINAIALLASTFHPDRQGAGWHTHGGASSLRWWLTMIKDDRKPIGAIRLARCS